MAQGCGATWRGVLARKGPWGRSVRPSFDTGSATKEAQSMTKLMLPVVKGHRLLSSLTTKLFGVCEARVKGDEVKVTPAPLLGRWKLGIRVEWGAVSLGCGR
jgi:hypothetical protein